MTDYKSTLNLPHTDFPMKANLSQREPEILAYWANIDLYRQLREQRAGQEKFILPDGPPYANGHIHLGHSVNKILKDIIVKSKTLSGFDAPYVPGWDCHGLPIELNVEKKHGKAGEKLTPKEFRATCRQYASEQIAIQLAEFMRLGVVGDWQHPYRTMDFNFEADIIRALAIMIANGHLQQGFKPVHWCVECSSALAEAEVEYANKTSPAIDVRFHVIDENALVAALPFHTKDHGTGKISVPIWTTTPWTLPANEAVAVHAEHDYVLMQVQTDQGAERLILAAGDLLKHTLERYGVDDRHELARFNGSLLENILLQHPFYERQVPIVLSDHVTLDAGTGAVHIAPAHGEDDYQVGLRYKLPAKNPVGNNGCYLATTPIFAGEHVFKANAHVISVLKEQHKLLLEQKIEHSYPHCWRHKTPLIFLATPQWFISMDKNNLREHALQAIKKVDWIPDWGQMRIYNMVAQRPDWCISRQRSWGVPIPLFIHKQTRELHPDTHSLIEKVAELVEKHGIDAWFDLDIHTFLGKDADNYEKSRDTLDVWFESGCAQFAVLKKNPALAWPADLFLEGSDQHRGWFQSSLLTSVGMYAAAPYKAVLTHGFTVDEKGRKMSKSLGNVIAPEKIINSLGADILRLWVSSTDYRGEIALSDEILKRAAEAYRRIRNTTRFLLANLHDFDPAKHLIEFDATLSLDQWLIIKAQQLQQEIKKAYDDYQFHLIYQKLHNFCVNELGGFYLDIIKDRQYTLQKDSSARRSAQTALYHLAHAMVRWLAPILSFTAEEIWQTYLSGKNAPSVLLTTWYEFPKQVTEVETARTHFSDWESLIPTLIEIREAVNKQIETYRSAGSIGSSLEAEVDLYFAGKTHLYELLTQLQLSPATSKALPESELRFVLITSRATLHLQETAPQDSIAIQVNHAGVSENLWIKVTPSTYQKCVRCWHRRPEVGNAQRVPHVEICDRCVENIEGKGEERYYA